MRTSDYMRFKVDWESGEATVEFLPTFAELSPLLRMDVLKDLFSDIQAQYEKATLDFRNQWRIAQMLRGRYLDGAAE